MHNQSTIHTPLHSVQKTKRRESVATTTHKSIQYPFPRIRYSTPEVSPKVYPPRPPPTPFSNKNAPPSILPQLLEHLAHDPARLTVHAQQTLALLALFADALVFVEQLLEHVLLVELADEAVLHDVLAVVDEEVHDGFGDLVGDGLAHDVEVGGDEAADELGFEGFAVGERGGGVVEGLGWDGLVSGK